MIVFFIVKCYNNLVNKGEFSKNEKKENIHLYCYHFHVNNNGIC